MCKDLCPVSLLTGQLTHNTQNWRRPLMSKWDKMKSLSLTKHWSLPADKFINPPTGCRVAIGSRKEFLTDIALNSCSRRLSYTERRGRMWWILKGTRKAIVLLSLQRKGGRAGTPGNPRIPLLYAPGRPLRAAEVMVLLTIADSLGRWGNGTPCWHFTLATHDVQSRCVVTSELCCHIKYMRTDPLSCFVLRMDVKFLLCPFIFSSLHLRFTFFMALGPMQSLWSTVVFSLTIIHTTEWK